CSTGKMSKRILVSRSMTCCARCRGSRYSDDHQVASPIRPAREFRFEDWARADPAERSFSRTECPLSIHLEGGFIGTGFHVRNSPPSRFYAVEPRTSMAV